MSEPATPAAGAGADAEARSRVPTLGEIGLNQFAPYLMNRIMGRYNRSLRAELLAQGLTTPKMRALAVLSVADGLINELAVFAIVEQSTLSRALDQLFAEGLVRRAADADDSRVTRIHITREGRAMFEKLWPSMFNACNRMFVGISESERLAFVATLQTMLRNIRQHEY
jgi:DNA-binding MarR family transcriptional regulator